jgi:osmotically-inducible protein OsmY
LVLSGNVASDHQRQTAGYAVRYLQGIKGIDNEITVSVGVPPNTIKADIDAAFKRRASIDAERIDVTVDRGEVTLSGVAGSLPELKMAYDTASRTAGVLKVVSHLTVSSRN